MIKTLTNLLKQDKEKFVVPKGVQDCIPITAIYDDGIFRVGKDKYSKSFKFTDINYAVASREDKEAMFLEYSELLNSLDSGATTKLTINNRRLNRLDFEKTILIPETGDELDVYREEYNKMLLDKATGANAIVQDKYVTISINKKSVEDARTYFARVGADLIAHFARLGSKCVELETDERLRIVHDFFRVGEETAYHFNIKETRKKGHDFKDYVCPDTMEFEKDYFKMGNRYGRVLFLREYASYIKDSMVKDVYDYKLTDTFMGFHCGNTPSCKLCSDRAVKYMLIQNRLLENGGEPDFTRGTLEGDIAPSDITFYRLQCGSDGNLRAYVAEGEVLNVRTGSFGGIGVFAIPEMGRFYRHVLLEKRFPHHGAVVFGHYGRILFEVFRMLGIADIGYNRPKSLPYPTENPFAK